MISVSRATSVLGINTRTCSSVGSVDYASVSNVDGTGSGCFDVRYSVSFPFKSARRGCSGFVSLLVPSLAHELTYAFIGKVKDRDDI